MVGRHGMYNWTKRGKIEKRDISTLILKDGVLEDLLEDANDFLSSKDDYKKYGIPYKKVYLFHGEPGTGKTSLSNILSFETNRSLYVLNFDPKMTDTDLSTAIKTLPSENAILLLEDIDCLFKQRDTGENLTHVSFSSILNNLDGAIVNKGLITIITTNHVKALDAALKRPLRVDKIVKFEKADADQITRIFAMYKINVANNILKNIIKISENNNLCPAGISGFLFRHRNKDFDNSDIVDLFKKYIKEIKIEDNDFNSMYT